MEFAGSSRNKTPHLLPEEPMPYRSEAQRKKFHALAKEGKISQKTVDEFDSSSKGLKLPDRLAPKKIKSIADIREKAKK